MSPNSMLCRRCGLCSLRNRKINIVCNGAERGQSTQCLNTFVEILELFSQLLDVKFDQKFAAFKRDLDEKEADTQSQLSKLKTESKASSSFNFKGNKVQYEFNSSLLDAIDGVIKSISKGNLSAANSELERVKTLIDKRNRLIRFADKSPPRRNCDQPRDERS